MKRAVFAIGTALLIGCAGEQLSVGDLRCEGPGVRCERPPLLQWGAAGPITSFEAKPERAAQLEWRTELSPCPDEPCQSLRSDVVAHPDGSLTWARESSLLDSDREALSLTRIATDGRVMWSREIEFPAEGAHAALGLDSDGQALLGVLREADGTTTVYRVDAEGTPERLFVTPGFYVLSAVAAVDDDVLLFGYHWSGDNGSAPNPELARFERDGDLVFRQAALRQNGAAELSADQAGLNTAIPLPLVVDADGEASVAVIEVRPIGLDSLVVSAVRVGSDGNVLWAARPNATISEAWSPVVMPFRLALDSHARILLAQDAYAVYRFETEGDPASEVSIASAGRSRAEFWEPTVLGFARDSQDRMLVATYEGSRLARRTLIDRLPPTFAERETFVLQDWLPAPSPAMLGLEGLAAEVPVPERGPIDGPDTETVGLLVLADDSVIVWGYATIARYTLP